MRTRTMKTKTMLIGIVSGFAAGAILGILFAPYKGRVTRRKIINQGEDITDAIKDKANEFVDVIGKKFDVVVKDIYTIKDKIVDIRKHKKATMN
jgi:gas vesicle protein